MWCRWLGVVLCVPLAANVSGQETLRSQAVVNLTFDEASGPALDSATQGAVKDAGQLANGAVRIRSPFWGQAGKQAVVLDAGAGQQIVIPDSADVDRPEAVTFGFLYANLHPANDGAFRGIIGKRDDAATKVTNYGINFGMNQDLIQVYINDSTGFKVAQFAAKTVIPTRRPVYLTAVLEVGDAPAADADTDRDDVQVRFYANGKPLEPRQVVGGFRQRSEAWLTDVKVASLVNNVPLTIGGSFVSNLPNFEPASAIVDEFSLFSRALSDDEAAKLFTEVIGAATPAALPQDGPPLQAGPEVATLSTYGLQAGQSTTLTISGSNLGPSPTVLLPVPIASQTLGPNPQPNQFQVTLSLAADVPPGHYPLRVQTAAGVTRPVPVAIDRLPQAPATGSTPEKPQPLPAALSGTLSGGQQVRVYVMGKAGQSFVADVESKRLGAGCSPVLELRNPRGTPVAIAWGQTQFRGDARIVTTLPVDGVYSLDLHDLSYNAPGTNPFRLKIGELKLADLAFPPVIRAGQSRPVELFGVGLPPTHSTADLASVFPGMSGRVNAAAVDVAGGPSVRAGDSDDIPEAPAGAAPQMVDAQFPAAPHVPVVVAGRISKAGEVDQYLLQVKPGMTLTLAADTQSISSPAVVQIDVLRPSDGALLSSSEDRGSVNYPVPGDLNQIKVTVRDLNGKGSPYHVYRLRVVPAGQPNFALALESNQVLIAQGGTSVVRVDVNRMGYGGPIKLAVNGPLSISPLEIPAGAVKTFVNVSANAQVPNGLHTVQIRGESVGLNPPLVRVAEGPADARMALVPNAPSELAAVVGASAGVALELGTLPPALFRGVDFSLPVMLKATDPAAAKAVVRLTLLTTEAPRQADPKDPAKGQKPVVRALPEQTLSAGETSGSVRIAVPLDVAETSLSCVLRADLVPHVFSDKVLASVYSPSFSLPVQAAGTAQVTGGTMQLKGGAETKTAGTFQRTAGFAEPVTVTLVNLPGGYSAPSVTVPGDQTAFELKVTAPAVTAAADIPNVVLRVMGAAGTPVAADVPVAVKVAP